jgi:hypothetical protein
LEQNNISKGELRAVIVAAIYRGWISAKAFDWPQKKPLHFT